MGADEAVLFRYHIRRMCEACEPTEKACRDAACPLRPVSPLKMHARPFGEPEMPPDHDGEGSAWIPNAGEERHTRGVVGHSDDTPTTTYFPRLLIPFGPAGGGMV